MTNAIVISGSTNARTFQNLKLPTRYNTSCCVCSSSVVVVVVHHRFFGRKVSPAVGLCFVGTHFRLPASKLTNKLAKLLFLHQARKH